MPLLPSAVVGSDDGEPMVFLHAANFDSSMWGGIIDRLDDERCLTIDLPGHGRAMGTRWISIEAAADSVAATIEGSGLRLPVSVVGLSLGSYVGFTLLERRPDLVRCAVLSGFHVAPLHVSAFNKVLSNLLSPLATTRWFRRRIGRSMGVDDDQLKELGPVSTRALRGINRDAIAFDRLTALPTIDVPLLAIAGEREQPMIIRSLTIMQREMRHCEARLVRGLGHGWPGQDPDLFAETVRAFVNEAELPPGLDRAP